MTVGLLGVAFGIQATVAGISTVVVTRTRELQGAKTRGAGCIVLVSRDQGKEKGSQEDRVFHLFGFLFCASWKQQIMRTD